MSRQVVIDIETTGLDFIKDSIHGVGVYDGISEPQYVTNLADIPAKIIVDIIGHNIRFDYKFLMQHGIEIQGNLFCTKLLAQLVNENQPLGLKELTALYFSNEQLENKSKLDELLQQFNLKHVGELAKTGLANDLIAAYCKEDCKNTYKLWLLLRDKMLEIHKYLLQCGFTLTPANYYIDEAVPFEKVAARMELRGVLVSKEKLSQLESLLVERSKKIIVALDELCKAEIAIVEDALYEKALLKRKSERGKASVQRSSEAYNTKFNWSSNQHLGRLLLDGFKLSARHREFTAKGQLDVSEYTLAKIQRSIKNDSKLYQMLSLYAEYKKTQKLLTTYVDGLKQHIYPDGRVHPIFKTADGTVTGRLSCEKPNIQNLPRQFLEIKECFIPDDGNVFIYFDYSQIELRLAAHLSQDSKMLEAYNNTNLDLHQMTANRLGVDRTVGKRINFALIYGCSAYRLQRELPDFTVEDCEVFRKKFFDYYSEYASYLESQIEFLKRFGFVISMFGRIRRLTNILHANPDSKEYKHAINQGLNFPIQSAAASICKRAMIKLDANGFKLVNQVHDAVYLEVEKNKAKDLIPLIVQIAENIVKLTVPLKVDIKILNSFNEKDLTNF